MYAAMYTKRAAQLVLGCLGLSRVCGVFSIKSVDYLRIWQGLSQPDLEGNVRVGNDGESTALGDFGGLSGHGEGTRRLVVGLSKKAAIITVNASPRGDL